MTAAKQAHFVTSLSFVAVLAAGACTGAPATPPRDPGVAAQEAAASEDERAAAREAAQYDPAQTTTRNRCSHNPDPSTPCWTVDVNPTKEHLIRAARLHDEAAAHRAASKALRDAEEAACIGIAPPDRDNSPLDHDGDTIGVEPLSGSASLLAGGGTRLLGAVITIRQVPGLSQAYLQRLVSCHTARNASMGFALPGMASCPLNLPGVKTVVEVKDGGYAVKIASDDAAMAAEILRRARSLPVHSAR